MLSFELNYEHVCSFLTMLLHFGEGLFAMFVYALLEGNLNQH